MQQLSLTAPGGLDQLVLSEAEDPGAPGPGEVRVRVRALSLNYHDFSVVQGAMPTANGRVPFSDASGVVEAVGPDVDDFVVGDAVVSCFFPLWQDGPPVDGDFSRVPGDGLDGFAQQIVVRPATWFTHAPQGWTAVESSTVPCAGLTAWRALVVNGGLRAGDVVLTLGTGGVSVYAIQLAKAMGATVIATSSSDDKLQRAWELGADHMINYHEDPEWGLSVLRITGGVGADHVVEVGGPGTLPQSLRAVRIGGHVAFVGVLTGRGGDVPTALLMAKHVRLQGLIVGSRGHQQDFVRALEATGVRPVIDRVFPLAEAAEAFRRQEAGQHFGKICLEI